MSQENVDIARRGLEAFNRGDRDAWLAARHEDYEILPIGDWPDAPAIRGREAGWNFYVDVARTLDFERADSDFVDAGADKVLGHQRHGARGRISRADVEVDYWIVTTFRDGRVLRDEWFRDRAEALEAVGLTE